MSDIRSSLADEIRRRAGKQRERADADEKSAADKRELAAVLEQVAAKADAGDADDKVGELLRAAHQKDNLWDGPLERFGREEESEVDRLRRVFRLGGAPLATAIEKL